MRPFFVPESRPPLLAMECQSTPMQLTHLREQARSHRARWCFQLRLSITGNCATNFTLFNGARINPR